VYYATCLFTPQLSLGTHSPYHEGMVRVELTWMPGCAPKWLLVHVVFERAATQALTGPSVDVDRDHCNALPLSQTGNYCQLHHLHTVDDCVNHIHTVSAKLLAHQHTQHISMRLRLSNTSPYFFHRTEHCKLLCNIGINDISTFSSSSFLNMPLCTTLQLRRMLY